MQKLKYIENFEKLGFGMFVHFGLYSLVGKGEWYLVCNPQADKNEYEKLPKKFRVTKNWAKNLVKTAKAAGCKYITLTTRHHDGFSLYDTCGLNTYDAPHSACGRDLVKEFVDACKEKGIMPFFYHTLLDWHEESYQKDFPKYIDYLVESVELLCKNYGKIGGIWFDGMWDKKNVDWQEDRIYGAIRKYQPEAMIINNTGLDALGKTGHRELDSVTFERGKPAFIDCSEKYLAGEMCQVLNDHWGYSAVDCNYKSTKELIENLVDCRKCNCNFLLNVGPKGNGELKDIDKGILQEIGKWVKVNQNFIYDLKGSDMQAENADILQGKDCYYAVIKNVPTSGDPNVQRAVAGRKVKISADIVHAEWLDNAKEIQIQNGEFSIEPFSYGYSYAVRVAKFTIKK